MTRRGSPSRPQRPLHRLAPDPGRRRNRILAMAMTGGAHLAVIAALVWPYAKPQPLRKPELASLQVRLLPSPKPTDTAKMAEAESSSAQNIPPPPVPQVAAPLFTIAMAADTSDLLSSSQLAGAARAGEGPNSGGGGGGCDMARAVQQALRRDRLVFASMESAQRLGKAMMLWNGDWVRSGGEDGKGLSAVREAVMWEVGFAPQACREARMHGLVLVSLADGRTRFAIGSSDWRWSDLLGVRSPAVR